MPPRRRSRFRPAVAALGGLWLLAAAGPGRAAEPGNAVTGPFTGHIDAPPAEAAQRVEGALFGHADLKPRRTDYEPTFHRPELGHPALAGFELYDEQGMRVDSVAATPGGGALSAQVRDRQPTPQDDPALVAYRALPLDARRLDLLIYVQSTRQWRVPEYPQPYVSAYVVHFAPALSGGASGNAGAPGTDLQVIGYDSRVKTGASVKRVRGDGLTLIPYTYSADFAPVAPSPSDRRALLGVLLRLAAAPPR